MQGQKVETALFCIIGNCENIALYGSYCKHHIVNALADMEQRAEAAEARAAMLEDVRDELDDKLIRCTVERDAAIKQYDNACAGFAEVKRAYDAAMTRLSRYEKVTA